MMPASRDPLNALKGPSLRMSSTCTCTCPPNMVVAAQIETQDSGFTEGRTQEPSAPLPGMAWSSRQHVGALLRLGTLRGLYRCVYVYNIYIYMCNFLYTYIWIHAYTYMCFCVCANITYNTRIRTYMHAYRQADRQTDGQTDRPKDRHTYKLTYLHTYTQHTYMIIRAYIHVRTCSFMCIQTCIHTWYLPPKPWRVIHL